MIRVCSHLKLCVSPYDPHTFYRSVAEEAVQLQVCACERGGASFTFKGEVPLPTHHSMCCHWLQELSRKYMRCSSRVTVHHLKRFLLQKLGVPPHYDVSNTTPCTHHQPHPSHPVYTISHTHHILHTSSATPITSCIHHQPHPSPLAYTTSHTHHTCMRIHMH